MESRSSGAARPASAVSAMDFLHAYGDDVSDGEEAGAKGAVKRKLASLTAPKDLLLPREEDEDEDAGVSELLGGSKRIVDRESEYHRRRLNRQLSPPRVDPFAMAAAPKGKRLRGYGDAVREANREKMEEAELRERQEQVREKEEGGGMREGTGEAGGAREEKRIPMAYRGRRPAGESTATNANNVPLGGAKGSARATEFQWGKPEDQGEGGAGGGGEPTTNFGLSGVLAEETLTVKGVKLKYTEPPEARKPDKLWRLYVFKAGKALEGEGSVLHVHRQSSYLLGRERRVVEIPTDHPSCSGQHAVLQFREVERECPTTGFPKKHVFPYLIDLGSTNGTFINSERLEPQRYYQLLEGDTIKFGSSSRDYVILHDKSAA